MVQFRGIDQFQRLTAERFFRQTTHKTSGNSATCLIPASYSKWLPVLTARLDFRTERMPAYHLENIPHCAFGRHRTSAEGKVGGEPAQSVSRRPASAHGNRPPLKLLRHAYATRTTICSCGFTCIQSECPQRTQIFSEVNRLMRGGGLACDCRRWSQLVLIRSPPFSCSTDAHLVIQGLTLVDRTFRRPQSRSFSGHDRTFRDHHPALRSNTGIPQQATQMVQDRAPQ